MAFSLRSPKLSRRPMETLKIPEISENFAEISEKRQMITLFEDSGYFCGASGLILNLTASFWVRSLRRFRNLTAQRLVFGGWVFIPLTPFHLLLLIPHMK
jgi:hypothetical protein